MNFNEFLQRNNPIVSKFWLHLAAGLMWSAVGVLLIKYSYGWLAESQRVWAISIGILGLVSAVVVYHFGFGRMALKNIRRINAGPDKACAFGFLTYKSYLVAAGMMAFGVFLRSSDIPRIYLAVLYSTIGGGLFLSSLEYYRELLVNFF